MSWFPKLCRKAGRLVHDVTKMPKKQRRAVSKTVEEKKINPSVTLRRTTIEEIEIREPPKEEETGS